MEWMSAVALATLMVGLFAWIRADVAALRKEMRSEFSDVRGEISDVRREISDVRGEISQLSKEVAALRERMAHTDGLLEGMREVVAGRQAA